MKTESKVELGAHVRAKSSFPVRWIIDGRAKKIADIQFGMEGIVTGFDRGIPIVNVVNYQLPVTLEPFDEFWERDRTVQLQVQEHAQWVANKTGNRVALVGGNEITYVYPEMASGRGTNQ